ncbi:XRE family transcriptional regulator [Levilactobacillus brevis]|nr:XRE family transcriptional regulator [Levilactobacillus brevis]
MNFVIGENIRARRKQLGLSQEKLAEYSHLSTNFISRLEHTNHQNISIQKLNQNAHALDTDVSQLLTNTSTEQDSASLPPNVNYLLKQLGNMNPSKANRFAKHFSDILNEI